MKLGKYKVIFCLILVTCLALFSPGCIEEYTFSTDIVYESLIIGSISISPEIDKYNELLGPIAIDENITFKIDVELCGSKYVKKNVSLDDCERILEIITGKSEKKSDIFELLNDMEIISNADAKIEPLLKLIENKLHPSWENILLYWKNFKSTEELINYLEKNANSFSKPRLDEMDEEFIKMYLISKGDDEAYRLLTTKLRLTNFDIPINQIPENKLKILIENKFFPLSQEIYNQIRSNYPDLILQVILNNQQEFIKQIKDNQLNNVQIYDLIIRKEATIELQESLLKHFDKTKMTEDIAIELSKTSYKIPNDVFFAAWNKLDDERKKELLYTNLSILGANDFERCFDELDEFIGFRERTRHNVKLEYNEKNQKLAERLKEVGYITSWKAENIEDKSISNEENSQILSCYVKLLNTKN